MRPHGRARVSSRSPAAFAICDRCGGLSNHNRLQWQFDYAGNGLINKQLLVCNYCLDVPQAQKRALFLSADPLPIVNPRIQDYVTAASDNRVVIASTSIDSKTGLTVYTFNNRVTSLNNVAADQRVAQEVGAPNGTKNFQSGTDINAVMPLTNLKKYKTPLSVISVKTDGISTLTMTCSSVHGLSSNDLVAIEGGGSNLMDGFYNVTVISATAFSYQPPVAVPNPGAFGPALLQPSTLFLTAIVGLPYGFTKVPQSGATP